MKKLRASRPSPALILSVLALVVALGGTAVAAGRISGYSLVPKTVGGGKLKQFTGGLLKKQTLGGGKVKPDTLGGFQIDESRLGTVPSAAHANAADTATSAASASSVAGDTRFDVSLGFGQSRTLATVGPLTLTAQCIQNGTDLGGEAGRDIGRILVSSSEAGARFQGSAEAGGLDPTTPEGQRVAVEYTVAAGGSGYAAEGFLAARAPNGNGLAMPAGGGAIALGAFGSACTFQGAAFRT